MEITIAITDQFSMIFKENRTVRVVEVIPIPVDHRSLRLRALLLGLHEWRHFDFYYTGHEKFKFQFTLI